VRVVKFYAVGAIGIAVQLAALYFFKDVCRLHYLVATVLAVEAAVLHNFCWHQRWTWRDRESGNARQVLARAARFNLTTGLTSIASNVVVMAVVAGGLGINYMAANLAAIAVTSVVNYLVADLFVFVPSTPR
jgi:dolichol-phosphate mannosyltransferase